MRNEIVNINIIATIILLIEFTLFFEFTNADIVFQNYLFNAQTHQWLINKNDFLLDLLFYSGIKKIYLAIYLFTLAYILFLYKNNNMKIKKKRLLLLLLSLTIVPLVISTLKRITHVPCPRELLIYGGEYAYTKSFTLHQLTKTSACYPAGHASGGFAFMVLFFLFKKPRYKCIAIISAVALGWVTGFYKMAIGDHFISHTITTMLLAWLIILLIIKTFSLYSSYQYKKTFKREYNVHIKNNFI